MAILCLCWMKCVNDRREPMDKWAKNCLRELKTEGKKSKQQHCMLLFTVCIWNEHKQPAVCVCVTKHSNPMRKEPAAELKHQCLAHFFLHIFKSRLCAVASEPNYRTQCSFDTQKWETCDTPENQRERETQRQLTNPKFTRFHFQLNSIQFNLVWFGCIDRSSSVNRFQNAPLVLFKFIWAAHERRTLHPVSSTISAFKRAHFIKTLIKKH